MKACQCLFGAPDAATLVRRIGPFHVHRGRDKGVIEIFSGDPQHPVQRLNLLGAAYIAALAELGVLLSEELNAEARVAIFAPHEGCSFSAGIDLTELAGGPVKTKTESTVNAPSTPAIASTQLQHRFARQFQDSVSSLARCRVPILAAIDGHCIGGATSLATACDVRYSTAKTIFSVKEAAVGLAADIGVLQRLPAIIGEGRTRELAYTARDFDGMEAKAMGFVEEVLPDYAGMLAHARQTAAIIARNSPLAVQNTKTILNWQRERQVQASLDYQAAITSFCLPCHDVAEAARAFGERRTPVFTDYAANTAVGMAHVGAPKSSP